MWILTPELRWGGGGTWKGLERHLSGGEASSQGSSCFALKDGQAHPQRGPFSPSGVGQGPSYLSWLESYPCLASCPWPRMLLEVVSVRTSHDSLFSVIKPMVIKLRLPATNSFSNKERESSLTEKRWLKWSRRGKVIGQNNVHFFLSSFVRNHCGCCDIIEQSFSNLANFNMCKH